MNPITKFSKTIKDKEFLLFLGLFILLFTYLILRVLNVPLVYDEIHTKWIYMIDFNPFPYMGYVDANNHFLNSLIGGIMFRLTHSDADWVFRFGSLMSFPIYFWSVYGFRSFFDNKYGHRLFATSMLCSAFLIEYFGLARGYGMSLAFLMLALHQTCAYLKNPKLLSSFVAVSFWILAISANLTILPFSLFGMVVIGANALYRRKYLSIVFPVFGLFPIYYFLKYSFHLKDIGKLYYGGQDGFFENTVHSLTPYLYETEAPFLDVILGFIFIMIVLFALILYSNDKKIFNYRLIFPVLLLLAVLNISAQNMILGINFPEDRSALYLVVFFFGALAFILDFVQHKTFAWMFTAVPIVFLAFQLNLSHSIFWSYEHFDAELLTEMEEEVQGIPPSTGGRFWTMDNELTRTKEIPGKVMQELQFPQDTILDYMVTNEELMPDYALAQYEEIYQDPISTLRLYKRKEFLNRVLDTSKTINFDFNTEFIPLFEGDQESAVLVRVIGYVENMNLHRKAILVVSLDNNERTENHSYLAYNLVESLPIQKDGRIHFDLTFAVNHFSPENNLMVYYWNQRKFQVQGEIKVEVYKI